MKERNLVIFLLLSAFTHSLYSMKKDDPWDGMPSNFSLDSSWEESGTPPPQINLGESPETLNGLSPIEVAINSGELELPSIQAQPVIQSFYYENSFAGLDLAFRHFCETLDSINENLKSNLINKQLFLRSSLIKLANIIRSTESDHYKVMLLHCVNAYITDKNLGINKNSILRLFPEQIRNLWDQEYEKLIRTPQEQINFAVLDNFLEIANSYFNIQTVPAQIERLSESAVKTGLIDALNAVVERFPSLVATARDLFEKLSEKDGLWVIENFTSKCIYPEITKQVLSVIFEVEIRDVIEFLNTNIQIKQ